MSTALPKHIHSTGDLPKVAWAKGSYVYDADGKQYIDGSGGPAVYCIGHSNAEVNAAIKNQLAAYLEKLQAPIELVASLAARVAARQMRELPFYNAFFLDHDDGAVYFNVMASGVPYLMGTERLKGSHSMSGYHSFELCYLAQVYTNLLITKQPLTLYFKPLPGGFKDNILRVSPDILPANSITISEVWIDDEPYSNFDAQGLTVKLPESKERLRVRVTVQPTK